MDYLLCIPARETNTRENCEKIHNVLARMSDTYKLRIVPEPVKNKQFSMSAVLQEIPDLQAGKGTRYEWRGISGKEGRDALEFLQDGGRQDGEKTVSCVPVFGGDRA